MEKQQYDALVNEILNRVQTAASDVLSAAPDLTTADCFTVTTGVSFYLAAEHIAALILSQDSQDRDALAQASVAKIIELANAYVARGY